MGIIWNKSIKEYLIAISHEIIIFLFYYKNIVIHSDGKMCLLSKMVLSYWCKSGWLFVSFYICIILMFYCCHNFFLLQIIILIKSPIWVGVGWLVWLIQQRFSLFNRPPHSASISDCKIWFTINSQVAVRIA